ncbi:MAG: LolA-related protein [Povalibacter sp.]
MKSLSLILALLMAWTSAAASESLTAETLISRLARPAPATIDFTEIRFSPLLKEPVIVSGTLGYAGPDTLDRHVTSPYREDTEIRGDAVKVRRPGEPERSFAIRRSPELQGLLNTFSSMLAGDHSVLERSFEISVSGNDDAWQLALTPRDPRFSKRVSVVNIQGHADQPQCFWIINKDAGASVMLLGLASHTELPQPLTREWLERKCR